jgi:hypothetical protein
LRLTVTQPLFAWEALEDCPSLQTVRDLLAIVPDGRLLDALRRSRGHGRDDYPVLALWGVVILTALLRHPTFDACLGELRRNAALRRLIGLEREADVPKKWNVSRFLKVLGAEPHLGLLHDVFNTMIRTLGEVVPDLGAHTAGDSSALLAQEEAHPDPTLPAPAGGAQGVRRPDGGGDGRRPAAGRNARQDAPGRGGQGPARKTRRLTRARTPPPRHAMPARAPDTPEPPAPRLPAPRTPRASLLPPLPHAPGLPLPLNVTRQRNRLGLRGTAGLHPCRGYCTHNAGASAGATREADLPAEHVGPVTHDPQAGTLHAIQIGRKPGPVVVDPQDDGFPV